MILLDTHALVWWAGGQIKELGRRARGAIEAETAAGSIAISSISAWEIAMLVERGRLTLSTDVALWLAKVSQIERVRFVPVDNSVAVAAVFLPGDLHRDPADRIIVATSRLLDATLVTADRQLRAYAHVRTIW